MELAPMLPGLGHLAHRIFTCPKCGHVQIRPTRPRREIDLLTAACRAGGGPRTAGAANLVGRFSPGDVTGGPGARGRLQPRIKVPKELPICRIWKWAPGRLGPPTLGFSSGLGCATSFRVCTALCTSQTDPAVRSPETAWAGRRAVRIYACRSRSEPSSPCQIGHPSTRHSRTTRCVSASVALVASGISARGVSAAHAGQAAERSGAKVF
jgi:hypothetical protein